ncbi:unnamed protein product, partial [Polarella glacialis]
ECNPASYEAGALHPGQPQLRPAFCTRSILALIADLSQISNLLTGASEACGKEIIRGSNCGVGVTQSVFASAAIGRFSAQLNLTCLEEVVKLDGDFLCSETLEGLAWNLDTLGSGLSSSIFFCKSNHPYKRPKEDYGACVGEVTS